MTHQIYKVSFRIFYENGNTNDHTKEMRLNEIEKWVEAYLFTHTHVHAISFKIWIEA